MSRRDLDRLLRDARSAGAPSAAERSQVREALARRIASGEPPPDLGEASLAPRSGRSLLGADTDALGLGGRSLGLGGRSLELGGFALAAVVTLVVAAVAAYGLGRGGSGGVSGGESVGLSLPSKASHGVGGAQSGASDHRARDSSRAMALPDDSSAAVSSAGVSSPAIGSASPAASKPPGSRAGVSARARDTRAAAARTRRLDREAERQALARVQHALRDGRFAEAIAGLDRDDRAFAGGALVEERAAARVLASCGSGDAVEARRLATAFVARHPGSPLRARVLASCSPSAQGERSR